MMFLITFYSVLVLVVLIPCFGYSQDFRQSSPETQQSASVRQTSDSLNIQQRICGTISSRFTTKDDILKEESLQFGEWPWLAAIYEITNSGSAFQCAGTLISSRAVITATRCVSPTQILVTDREALKLRKYEVYLGQNIGNNRSDGLVYGVKDIYLFPGFTIHTTKIENDTTVLILDRDVIFTELIRPACLASETSNDIGEKAFLAGWGRSESNTHMEEPRLIAANIATDEECIASYSPYASFLSSSAFCASNRNGIGPCIDSGAGLLVNKNGRWTLRGVMATTLTNSDKGVCRVDYALYTDVRSMTNDIQMVEEGLLTPPDITYQIYDKNLEGCGQVDSRHAAQPLGFGGVEVPRGSWPWLAAIYKNGRGFTEFCCSGTLISKKNVVTAAHCFKAQGGFFENDEILVYLGRFNIENPFERDYQLVPVANISNHKDYNSENVSFDADISIITLNEEVPFTQYIQPACVWPNDNTVVGEDGFVVGWGRNGRRNVDRLTPTPRKVTGRVVSDTECLRSNAVYQQITSNRTICAGNRDGTGPCKGDSGGGLMIKKDGKWYLRGIVSVSLAHPIDFCNLKDYVVYSDVAKFLGWISHVISST